MNKNHLMKIGMIAAADYGAGRDTEIRHVTNDPNDRRMGFHHMLPEMDDDERELRLDFWNFGHKGYSFWMAYHNDLDILVVKLELRDAG